MSYVFSGMGRTVSVGPASLTYPTPPKRGRKTTCLSPAAQADAAERCKRASIVTRGPVCAAARLPICNGSRETTCVSKARQNSAKITCLMLRLDCAAAALPICGIAESAAQAAQSITGSGFTARAAAAAAPPRKRASIAAPTAKLPVPVAAPAPMLPPAPPAPEPGVPLWVWIAGGAAVLGTGAYLYSRKKGS